MVECVGFTILLVREFAVSGTVEAELEIKSVCQFWIADRPPINQRHHGLLIDHLYAEPCLGCVHNRGSPVVGDVKVEQPVSVGVG